MAKLPITFAPGVSTVKSPLQLEARFDNCNLIRFFGSPAQCQKRGGWSALSPTPLAGSARGLHAWTDLQSIGYVAAGTEQLLQLLSQDALTDISPIVQTSDVANAFSTIAGSSTVTVRDPNRTPDVGDWIDLATAVFIGGLVLQGDYQETAVVAGGYEIDAGAVATTTTQGSGTTFNFSTQQGSAEVTVTLGQAALVQGEFITVFVPTPVGGITISGEFQLTVTAGVATINAGTPAANNANASENGGDARILYPLPSVLDSASPFVFGAGRYGGGAFGVGEGTQTKIFVLREWSLDNFGQILIANPKGEPLFSWTPPVGFNNRATNIANGPQVSQGCFVAMPQEQIVSFGSDGGGFQDPMLLRWCDVADFSGPTSWTATAINQAGSFRLTRGSKIVGALQAAQRGLIWTDVGLWTMNYIQPPFIYGFDEVAKGCGLIAMRAAAEVAGKIVWPSYKGFFMYDGSQVVPLPCEVWSQLFDTIDPQYINALNAFPNSDFNEIAWHFPALGSNGVPTHYISLNVGMLNAGYPPDQCWDFGTLTGTACIDRTGVAPPLRADGVNGLIQAHETATDANGAPMSSFAETGWFKLNGSTDSIYLDRLIPDFVGNQGWSVEITVMLVEGESPTASPVRTYGPFTASAAIEHVIVQGRGKFIKLKFDFSAVGSFARIASVIHQSAPAGRT
jgi:hypothetical protein